MAKAKALSVAALVKVLAAQTPADWTITFGVGWTDGGWETVADEKWTAAMRWIKFTRGTTVVALNISPLVRGDRWQRAHAFRGCTVEGHTLLDGGSFTRHGIDTHSCGLVEAAGERDDHDYGSLAELLVGEDARCAAALARRATAESVAGLPYTRQPEWFTKTAADLVAGKSVRLTPHGMGQGHILRRGKSRFGERAVAALEARLNVAPIYVETFDHD